jgi:endoglucanase
MIDIELLKKITETPGAPGFEHPIRNFISEQIKDLVDEMYTDALGNLVGIISGKEPKKVAVAAHMDEISFIVSFIDENGFVRFHPLGGFDPKTLTSQRVIIHGKKDVLGVMGSKPIHIMKPEERKKAPEIQDFFIDTGYTKEELEKLIDIGDPVTRQRELVEMGDCICAKSLDNRISVYVLIEALRKIKGKTLPYDLYAVFTVQEEVGIRGAMKAAHRIDPDFGIALDTTIAFDVPGSQPHEQVTKLGEGAGIKIADASVICDNRMVRFIREVAKNEDIRWQHEIMMAGGTDTAAIQRYGKNGAISGAISIPTRHIHQVIEMVHKKDVEASIDLLEKCLLSLDRFDWSHISV